MGMISRPRMSGFGPLFRFIRRDPLQFEATSRRLLTRHKVGVSNEKRTS